MKLGMVVKSYQEGVSCAHIVPLGQRSMLQLMFYVKSLPTHYFVVYGLNFMKLGMVVPYIKEVYAISCQVSRVHDRNHISSWIHFRVDRKFCLTRGEFVNEDVF